MDIHLSLFSGFWLTGVLTAIPAFCACAGPDPDLTGVRKLMDFGEDTREWRPEHDGVMGGVSTGSAEIADGQLLFSGELSLKNNGGFASVKTPVENGDWSSAGKIVLRVKGDGRSYQVRLATDALYRQSRISYGASFPTTDGTWTEVALSFNAFRPSHHGRPLDGPPLDLENIREIRLLLGDGRAGGFALRVDWIGLR